MEFRKVKEYFRTFATFELFDRFFPFVIVFFIFLYFFIIGFVGYKAKVYEKRVKQERSKMEVVKELAKDYKRISTLSLSLATRSKSLISIVEEIGRKVGISENIVSISPKTYVDLGTEGAEIKLEKLNLKEVVGFLKKIEEKDGIYIEKVKIRQRFDNPKLLDTEIIIFRKKAKR